MDASRRARDYLKATSRPRVGAVGAIVAILVVTILELPPPIGFETRPQAGVSIFWGLFFLAILVVEITAIVLIIRRSRLGAGFGIAAAALNIMQVIADQSHLMQPEVAPLDYSALEGLVVLASIALIFFSLDIRKEKTGSLRG